MSEARTDTTHERPQSAAAGRGDGGGAGKHRGGAATEDAATQPHGRHRRPSGSEGA
ncbi:hypothetical protein ACWD01_22195 [Streptomyces sp. NPDC002835]